MIETAEEYEKWLYAYAFKRMEWRHTRLKRILSCGHVIDGGTPYGDLYRYQVWKLNGDTAISQLSECDVCARIGNHY